jgi:glycosyltransferase involved in cell wall biosynthesis
MNRILVISNAYPSNKNDTYGVFIKYSCEQLESNGFNINLCVIKGRASNIFIKTYKYLKFYIFSVLKILFIKYDFIYVHHFTHSLVPIKLLNKKINCPIIINAHGYDVIPISKFGNFLSIWLSQQIKKCELCIVPSEFFMRKVMEKYKIDKKNIFISPSGGINTNIFNPLTRDLINLNNYYDLGFISRIDYGKGWEIFLKVLYKIVNETDRNIKAVVVGDGKQKNIFFEKVHNLNLRNNITYFEAINHQEIADIYRKCKVIIFPTNLEESLGLVGLEAMSSGCILIASRIGAIGEYLINEENGFSCEPNEVEDFINATNRALKMNGNQYSKIIKNGINTGKNYDSKLVGIRLSNKIRSILIE